MWSDNAIAPKPPALTDEMAEAPLTHAESESLYRLCRLSEAGIGADEFLSAPREILHAQGQDGAIDSLRRDYLPLLPAQAAIAKRLRDEEEDTDHDR